MAYKSMKKLIENLNNQYNSQLIDAETYNMERDNLQNKLDVFYAMKRLNENQYEELTRMIIDME